MRLILTRTRRWSKMGRKSMAVSLPSLQEPRLYAPLDVQTQRKEEPEPDAPSSPSVGKKRKHSEVEDGDTRMEFADEINDARKQLKDNNSKKQKQTKKIKGEEKEYSTSRGVDFLDVACVVNFDLPLSSRSYVHRVGRTARAGRGGVAISFVVTTDSKIKVRHYYCSC